MTVAENYAEFAAGLRRDAVQEGARRFPVGLWGNADSGAGADRKAVYRA